MTQQSTVPFGHLSLNQIEQAYRYGSVTDEQLDAYLKAWNETPGRFTFAYWQDGAIRQRNRP